MTDLKPYMAWAGEPEDGAVLVFARRLRDARRLAYPFVRDWTGCDYLEVSARWLRGARSTVWSESRADYPHVIESPQTCEGCELWGQDLADGLCEDCADRREADSDD